jgi:ferritin-like metal-binding protein YciE
MEKLNDLHDLLKHNIQDLYSAEEQIMQALPSMIEKAQNPELKQALTQHLGVTEQQRVRLDLVQSKMNSRVKESISPVEKKGLLARLFKRSQVCKGMKGLIEEGEKVISEDMNVEVRDAAIIACAQKMEHYEICGYGTARAYAQELGLTEVVAMLQQTLDEEYTVDDKLTYLAVGRLNEKAEKASGNNQSKQAKQKENRNNRQTVPTDNSLENFTAEVKTKDAISRIRNNGKRDEHPDTNPKKKSTSNKKGSHHK